MENLNKRSLQLEVLDEGILHYGQHVFDIFCTDSRVAYSKCPVCKEGKFTIGEMDFVCPKCHGSDIGNTSLTLYNYEPNEHIINEIIISGPVKRGDFDESGSLLENALPIARYRGFSVAHAAKANGDNFVSSREFYAAQYKSDHLDKGAHPSYHDSQAWFTDLKDAEEYIQKLHDIQKKRLDAFNLEHGTNHEYPFKI